MARGNAMLRELMVQRGFVGRRDSDMPLAAAQHRRNPAGDFARLRRLLALSGGDPSPRIAKIRGLVSAKS